MSFINKMFIYIYSNVEQFTVKMCFNATIRYGDYNPKWPTRNVLRLIYLSRYSTIDENIFSVYYSSKDEESKSDIPRAG